MEAVQDLKDIFAQVKAKIESGEVKDNIIDFLTKSRPLLMLRLLLPPLLSRLSWKRLTLPSKLSLPKPRPELNLAKVFWLTCSKPSLPKLVSSRITLLDTTSLMIFSMMSSNLPLSMLLKTSSPPLVNIFDFLNKIKAAVDAKIAAATPAVKAILEKVDAAVQAIIAKAKAGVESGKGLLVDLLETIIAKIGELKDNIAGYNIFEDLLNDVLKPALKHAIENLIPTIGKHLGDLADKLKTSSPPLASTLETS